MYRFLTVLGTPIKTYGDGGPDAEGGYWKTLASPLTPPLLCEYLTIWCQFLIIEEASQ